MSRALAIVLLALAGAMLWAHLAHADGWVAAAVTSYHQHDEGYNHQNFGPGLEAGLSPYARAVGGAYRNSLGRETVYAGVQLLTAGTVRLGATVGCVTGYAGENDRALRCAPVPTLAIEGRRLGVNVMGGFGGTAGVVLGLQVKARAW